MTSVIVQKELADQLAPKGERVEIRSEDGTLLGHFVPALEADEELRKLAREPFTEDDVERALNSNEAGGRSWPEIRDELEAKCPST